VALVQRCCRILLLAAGFWSLAQFVRFKATELKSAGGSRAVFYGIAVIGFGTCALQIYNLAVLERFWPFLTAIVASVFAASLQFARLVLNRPARS